MNEINSLISVAWADHLRLFPLLPTLEKLENKFRPFDIPSVETQSVKKVLRLRKI